MSNNDDDDGLILNVNSNPSSSNHNSNKTKGNKKKQQPKKPQAKPKQQQQQPLQQSKELATDQNDADESSQQKKNAGKRQVVSSLFSSNPEIQQPKSQLYKKNRTSIPSNAPVADSTTFTGLGVEPDLVELLGNKLNVNAPTNIQRKAIPLLLGPARTVQGADIPEHDVDVVVQAETGSGKTLTYLLPIVNRLIAASTSSSGNSDGKSFGDRAIGTVAIILTPTRELAQQVTSVLSQIVNLPKPKNPNVHRSHWIVPGIIIGGDNRNKEKARLRKGINILVSTPGRLLDHLEKTQSFEVRDLKWLVLDEADRLLDLGFEETLKKIMAIIENKTRAGGNPKYKEATNTKYWPARRQTVLCSATLRQDVKHLAGWFLKNPSFVSGSVDDKKQEQEIAESIQKQQQQQQDEEMKERDDHEDVKFSTPNQLKQSYTITPAKLRLVTLVTMLKSCFVDAKRQRPKESKVIVFFSSCDSVDFHYDMFSKAGKKRQEDSDAEMDHRDDSDGEDDEATKMQKALAKIMGGGGKDKDEANKDSKSRLADIMNTEDDDDDDDLPYKRSELLGNVPVLRLHGDLDQKSRTQSYSEFSKLPSGVLLCTDVAARGLDLPNVDRIIQYDPPTDLKDYVHRVGRTARLGKAGSALLFLLPSEMEYLDVLKAQDMYPESITMESVLSFLGQNYQIPAQELQNKMERYVLEDEEVCERDMSVYENVSILTFYILF